MSSGSLLLRGTVATPRSPATRSLAPANAYEPPPPPGAREATRLRARTLLAVTILLATGALGALVGLASVNETAELTPVRDVVAGRVAAGKDVTLEETRVLRVVNASTCTMCATWEVRTVVTLEALSDGARVDAVLKKVGGNLLQYKKQNGVPLVGMIVRLGGTVANANGAWSIDPAKEWVEFAHEGPTVTLADVNAGRVRVGSYVWLEPASPWKIFHSTDGDYHIEIQSRDGTRLTTETTPPHQDELPTPKLGDDLEVFGMVLYDADHDHWEVHPIRCLRRDLCAGSAAPPAVPGAPTALRASAGDGEVRLTWRAPDATGSGPVTAFGVHRGEGEGALAFLRNVTRAAFTDANVTNGVRYRYAVSAWNAAGEGPRSPEAAAVPGAAGATEWLAEDFESEIDGWGRSAAEGGSAWTITDRRAATGVASITCGTGSRYAPSTDCALVTPPLDLRRATSAALAYREFADTAGVLHLALVDRGVAEGSRDGGASWLPLVVAPRSTGGAWADVAVDLAPLLGAADTRVRWRFTSDALLESEGWFVDAVRVAGVRRAPSPPAALAATWEADRVALAWTASPDADAGATHLVYRGASADALAFYAEAGAGASFVDAAPDADARWYAVSVADALESARSAAAEAVPPRLDVLFSDDFESGAAGWTIVKNGGTGTSTWKLVTTQAASPTHSFTCGGGSSYAAGSDCELVSPVIDVGTAGASSLRFSHRIGGEAGRDVGRVSVSVDGGAWTEIGGPYAGVGAWTGVVLDLPPATTVKVKFRFTSDTNGVQNAAWFVDDVQVTTRAG